MAESAVPRVADESRGADADPWRVCDIVMKGGITSGVVYPLAVCELARTYRFASVGGTSAGAIAAAAAAAAEYGRASGGFERLAGLPKILGTPGTLESLFQPQRRTRPLFRMLMAGLGRKGLRLATAVARAGLVAFWPAALLGALPGLALILLTAWDGGPAAVVAGALLGAVLIVVGALLGAGVAAAVRAVRAIPENGFGLCSGMGDGAAPALTEWLADTIDEVAGRPTDGPPLTFGDLRRGPAKTNLQMMTTNLTTRRAERLPGDGRAYFFDPAEMRRRFPERVVARMEAHPAPPESEARRPRHELTAKLMAPLRRLPLSDDLPVVVAARMSLSFPLLISAVPLHGLDWSRASNATSDKAWDEWLTAHKEEWPALRDDPAAWEASQRPATAPAPETCWFSDGGISSNFPVHFFDRPLPRWPTFAITLDPVHPDHPKGAVEEENVWLPEGNVGGLLDTWRPFPETGWQRLAEFGGAIIRTMQNRVDAAQSRMPGYRDRIAHIVHSEDEGGMNLNMGAARIDALTERGAWAGRKLAARFAVPVPTDDELTWDNHRWVRVRTLLASLEGTLATLDEGYRSQLAGERSFAELVGRPDDEPPASYRWSSIGRREAALERLEELMALCESFESDGQDLTVNAPSPGADLRMVPPT